MGLTVNEILVRMIKSIDLFKELDDNDCLSLANHFILQYYTRWTVIIREWTRPDKIYILKNWKLEVKKANWMWNIVLGNLNPGDIFGEMSYLKDQNAMATVWVVNDSDIWEIPVSKFDEFLKKNPKIMDIVYNTLKLRENENRWKMSSWWTSDVSWNDNINIIL